MNKIKINYRCRSWQGFVQQLVYLVSRGGYFYYCLVQYPLEKKEKWEKIDTKLIGKYQCDKSKYQRARNKNKGFINFYFIRYGHIALIMHTPGKLPEGITIDDPFFDCRDKKHRLNVPVGSMRLWIMPPGDPNHRSVTVQLAKQSYRDIKASLSSVCRAQYKKAVIAEYDRLNGLPAWSGIVRQKRMLARYTVRQARKNCIPLQINELRLNTRRTIYKVWQ
jgi:DNA-binding cell septation regulator SpoVG